MTAVDTTSAAVPTIADGRRVSLRPLAREDYAELYHGRAELSDLHILQAPKTAAVFEDFCRWLDGIAARSIFLAIQHKADGRMVGFYQVFGISPTDQRASMISFLAPQYRGNWLGQEASHLLFDYLFGTYNLRKISMEVAEFNLGWVGPLVNLGIIVQEGRLRQHVSRQGEFFDVLCLALYRDRYMQVRKQGLALFGIRP